MGLSVVRSLGWASCLAFIAASGCASSLKTPRVEWRTEGPVAVGYAGSWPLVQATVSSTGGQRHRTNLIVDTGCEGVALSTSLIATLGLESAHRYVAYEGSPVEKGGVGRGATTTHHLARVDLGACALEGGEVIGVPMPSGLDALAGLAAFPGRALVLDPGHARVVFVPHDVADRLIEKKGAQPLAARRVRHTLRVKVQLGADIECELLVDTGARYSWIAPRAARVPRAGGFVQGRLSSGGADLGLRSLRVESDGSLQGGLGSDVLLGLGRPVLLDLERERVVLLPVNGVAPPQKKEDGAVAPPKDDDGVIIIKGSKRA